MTAVLSDEQCRLVRHLCENELQSLAASEHHDEHREAVADLMEKVDQR